MLGVASLPPLRLSGFAGVYLEKMFTSGATCSGCAMCSSASSPSRCRSPPSTTTMWRRQQFQPLQGFKGSTWLVVLVQVAGALLTAIVITRGQRAEDVCDGACSAVHLLSSMLLFDFAPTTLFGVGIAATAFSIWLYASPTPARRRRRGGSKRWWRRDEEDAMTHSWHRRCNR